MYFKLFERKRTFYCFILLILLLVFFFLIDLLIGNTSIKIGDILFFSKSSKETQLILFNFRFPKAIAAIVAGSALGAAGLLTQTFFRNPLAGPDVLGISSGASLGVAIFTLLLQQFFPSITLSASGSWGIIISACIGAALTMLLISILSAFIKDNITLLVVGLMIGAVFSSFITIIQYVSNEALLKSYIVWGFGSIRHLSMEQVSTMIPFVIIGIVLAIISIRSLNALLLGEKQAQSLGISISRTRFIIFVSIILLSGTITAFCGPIAFVAITVPHICRLVFNSNNHSILIPASILIGGIMLLVCDILSQFPGASITLPLNAITSIMGIPVIIWILFRGKIN
jgi:iron complex transport system permease protein